MQTYAIVPAAGRGLRMGLQTPKQFIDLSGKPLLIHTIGIFEQASFLNGLFLVVPEDFLGQAEQLIQSRLRSRFPIKVVQGGAERQDSVFNALKQLPAECEWVMVHDGVRPFVTSELLETTRRAAEETGAAIAALPATDTVKRVEDRKVRETLPRDQLWLVQTPQVFRKDILVKAYEKAQIEGWLGTDDASLVERLNIPVSVVHGERTNIKVTTPEDLDWANWFLSKKRK